jgi:phosphate transport system protein
MMERTIDRPLHEMRQNLLRMSGAVEAMIAGSMESLIHRDDDRAEAIIGRDAEIDDLEKRIDEECLRVMATQQPTARDLRLLVVTMKINNNLERIADSTVNICRSVKLLNREPPLKPYIDLPRMSSMVAAMVRDSLDSLVELDSAAALDVCGRDDEVDAIYKQLFRELLTYMIEQPRNVSRALQLLFIAHNLERIADHATNVAEDVIYLINAVDIRHGDVDEVIDEIEDEGPIA